MQSRFMPDFLYIGPPKAGSTWLYELLRPHPDVCVPALKDLYYFDRYYDRGNQWYRSQFSVIKPGVLTGEICHDYLYSDVACERIAADAPKTKIITILRDPVDRAISHYKYSYRFGHVAGDFFQACKQNPLILECGMYGKYLSHYFSVFPPSQMGVFFFDRLKHDPEGLAEQILTYLGLSSVTANSANKRVNAEAVPRFRAAAKLAKMGSGVLRSLGWTSILGVGKRSKMLSRLLYSSRQPFPLEIDMPSVREFCREIYAEDSRRLSVLLGEEPPWLLDEDSTHL